MTVLEVVLVYVICRCAEVSIRALATREWGARPRDDGEHGVW